MKRFNLSKNFPNPFNMIIVSLTVALFATVAHAGILQVMKEAAGNAASSGSLWAGLATVALLYLFKAIPNKYIYNTVHTICKKAGIVMTLGLSKWKWSAPLWNATIEPYFVDLLVNTIGAATSGLIEGLKSDNQKES